MLRSLCLQPHRQHHVKEVVAAVHRGQHAGADAGVQLHDHLVRRGKAQGVHKIAVVKADFQIISVAGNGAAVFGVAVAGAGRELYAAVAKNTVTNETIAIRLAGIRTTKSLAQDFYQTNGTIATLAFDPMGADADGRAYAYVWLGDTLLNQLMLDKGLAQIDAAFAQSPSPYFEQLSASNEQSKQPHSTAP